MTLLEYIESTGTQWIDTGVKPNQNYSIEVKFQTSQQSKAGVLVCDENWNLNGFGIFSNTSEWGTYSFNTNMYGASPVEVTLRNAELFVNGSSVHTFSPNSFACPVSLTLFCLNRNGIKQEFMTGRLYYARVYVGNDTVKEYLPAKDSNGVACLYDNIAKEYVYNSGSGNFISGPEVAA